MDNNDLKERDFEAYIEHWLTTEGGYVKGSQATYDKERALDLKTLIKFLRLTQTKKWELYEKKYGAQTEDRLYNVLQDKIHERGLIWYCAMASTTWASSSSWSISNQPAR